MPVAVSSVCVCVHDFVVVYMYLGIQQVIKWMVNFTSLSLIAIQSRSLKVELDGV